MKGYTVHLEMQSTLVTEFQSDTIFGHICWAVRYLQWPQGERLSNFLMAYQPGQTPPLLVSNGFPKGCLPKPVIPPVTQVELERIALNDNRIAKSFIIKSIKKMPLILKEDFIKMQKAEITPVKLFETLYGRYGKGFPEEPFARVAVQHNTVNRATGRVDSGLYSQEETFFPDNGGEYVIYLKGDYFTQPELERIFGFIAREGFGKDKSTGKGHFSFTIEAGIDLPECERPNAFMTLSSFIPTANDPTANDPTDGHYTLLHKYGKLGGGFASGASGGQGNPFKKPLLMFAAGSIFRDPEFFADKVYGSTAGRRTHQPGYQTLCPGFSAGDQAGDKQ